MVISAHFFRFCDLLYILIFLHCKRVPWVHLMGCWGVKLFLLKHFLKFCLKLSFARLWVVEFCQSLSFWVLSESEFWILIEFEFWQNLSFFYFCQHLNFWLVRIIFFLKDFWSFVAIWVFEFGHSLSFSSLVTI